MRTCFMQNILTSQTEESGRKTVLTQFLHLYCMLGKGICRYDTTVIEDPILFTATLTTEHEVVSVLYSVVMWAVIAANLNALTSNWRETNLIH